ncbi:MAG: glycosyltransferase family 2 protein [Candidatus Bathyarchaeia archaeon]|jgi:glycosyltransferase involved in cell wall biosynthesis
MLAPAVSVVIPAFNEGKSIGDVISKVRTALGLSSVPYEIVVVDDGSSDETGIIARSQNVRVVSNWKNRGKGVALRRGFECALGHIIVTIDADGSHDPRDIGKLVRPILDGADVVLGCRFLDGQGRETTTRLNVFGNSIINFAIWLVTGKKVRDSQTGFRAFRRKVLQEFGISAEGFQVEAELTVKMLMNGNDVREVPITIRKRMDGASRLNPLRDGLKDLLVIMKAAFEA